MLSKSVFQIDKNFSKIFSLLKLFNNIRYYIKTSEKYTNAFRKAINIYFNKSSSTQDDSIFILWNISYSKEFHILWNISYYKEFPVDVKNPFHVILGVSRGRGDPREEQGRGRIVETKRFDVGGVITAALHNVSLTTLVRLLTVLSHATLDRNRVFCCAPFVDRPARDSGPGC